MVAGVAGFAHAPVTKLLVLGSVSLSLFAQSWVSSRAVSGLRTLSRCLVLQGPGELVFGGGLLYHTRVFERCGAPLLRSTGQCPTLRASHMYKSKDGERNPLAASD